MVMKIKKKKKSTRMRGSNTHGHGAMLRGSGHRGGVGMAGSGKRADQKKTLIIKKYGKKYFGKAGITSKKTQKRKIQTINLREIQNNLSSLTKKYGKKDLLDLKDYKILGEGELKEKLIIRAKAFTKSVKEKIEKTGGKIMTPISEKKLSEKEIIEEKK